jgi:hypothetical protein
VPQLSCRFARGSGFSAGKARSWFSNSDFPVSEERAAGGFDSLTGNPEIIVRQQGSYRAADIVGQSDPSKSGLRSEEFVDLFVVTHNTTGEIGFN